MSASAPLPPDAAGRAAPRWTAADERRHADAPVEAWWWWGAGLAHGGHGAGAVAGVFVGIELRGRRFDYWAGLVRDGSPYLYIEELDSTALRDGLEVKPPEMWAGHTCDDPFRQWSLGNEAHGVLLDDPTEAWRRAYGHPVPTTFDVEWYAADEPDALQVTPGVHGYRQRGEVDVRIELLEGVVAFDGPAERVHVWGAPFLPSSETVWIPGQDTGSLRAPYRRHDGRCVDQVLRAAPALQWLVGGVH